MPEVFPIHDLFIRRIPTIEEPNATRLLALRDTDHLLRRFGQAEVVHTLPGSKARLRSREVADEVWALIEGQVEFVWHDLRQDSPTYDRWHRLTCDKPTLVLVPFGVAFGYRALAGSASLLRLTTHSDGEHDGDQELNWETKV